MHTAPSRLPALPEIESRHPDPDKCIPPTPLPVLGPAATSASPKRKSTWLPPGRWISSRIARKQHSRSDGQAAARVSAAEEMSFSLCADQAERTGDNCSPCVAVG